ncbi:hypothetical protein [Clostridium folliculivorans]|uniref:Uncharacterized protein n=1 Tax=Clostridium folliculivorans TaxID=2886038 RepID=A0A9W6DC76_9CLOT|nr:hypothetical protein [Clostridium folliculivorans]GKU26716.1 hypothetical protein CFOLD11_35430 [Clostridium folliculivorans]GKU28852.1 hypothetical protein CFB3_09580 [Clostridium folliculivorans]
MKRINGKNDTDNCYEFRYNNRECEVNDNLSNNVNEWRTYNNISCQNGNVYYNDNRVFVFLSSYISNGNSIVPFANSNIQISLRSFIIGLAVHLKENDGELLSFNNNVVTNDPINKSLFTTSKGDKNRFIGILSIYSSNGNAITQSLNYNIQISMKTFIIVLLSYYREAIPQLYFRNNNYVIPERVNRDLEGLFIVR